MNSSKPINFIWPRGKLFWRTSLHQPPGNGLFSWTPVNQSFFDKHKGHRGFRPLVVICGTGLYYTIKNL